MSGIAIEPGLYRTRTVIQRAPGSADGYLWQFAGKEPHALHGLEWLPQDTVYAFFTDLDLKGIWNTVKAEAHTANLTSAQEALEEFSTKIGEITGRPLEEQLDSFGGDLGVALVLNPSRSVALPLPDGPIEIPEPSLLIAFRVKDDLLFDWLNQVLAGNPQSTAGERDGVRWRSLAVAPDAPFPLLPTLGRAGDYLWLASNEQALQAALNTQAGLTPGLLSTPEFKHLSQELPTDGNSFAFVSERFTETLWQVQGQLFRQAMDDQQSTTPAELFRKLVGAGPNPAAYSVTRFDATGLQMVGQGTQEPATVLVSSALVAPTAVMAGMLLPALAKAKEKARAISCVNNLKQIGLGLRIFAVDHDGSFPPDLASIKEILASPRVLVCPNDPAFSTGAPVDWSGFDFSHCSYEYLTPGIKETDAPDTVVVRCRIHGSVCHLDGSVRR